MHLMFCFLIMTNHRIILCLFILLNLLSGLKTLFHDYLYHLGEGWAQQTDTTSTDPRMGEVLSKSIWRLQPAPMVGRHFMLSGLWNPSGNIRRAS